MTIRRDLDRLETEGLIRRTHGGAVTESLGEVELDFTARRNQNARAKRQIGQAAAALVREGDVIFLDAGSTLIAMAEFLVGKRLTVVTHSLPIADRLAGRDGIEVFLLGGQVRRDLMSVVGYRAEESLASFRLDKAFLGTAASTFSAASITRRPRRSRSRNWPPAWRRRSSSWPTAARSAGRALSISCPSPRSICSLPTAGPVLRPGFSATGSKPALRAAHAPAPRLGKRKGKNLVIVERTETVSAKGM